MFIRTGKYFVHWFVNGDERMQMFITEIVDCNSFAEVERDFFELPHITENVIVREIVSEVCEEQDANTFMIDC